MAENMGYSRSINPFLQVGDVQRKRAPLGLICQNIKYDDSDKKMLKKCQKQQDFLNTYCVRDFEIFTDENEARAAVEEEEDPMQEYLDEIDHKIFSPNHFIKYNEIPSEVVEETEHEREKPLPAWCSPYKEDIYSYFRKIEQEHRPSPTYMNKQTDISLNMRSILVDWLLEVAEEYKLNTETFYLTISYVDRFLSRMSVMKEKLQLVGTASMFIASKYEEIYPPEVKEFVYITDDTYNKKQVIRMEHLILKALNFNISGPTAYTFLQLYCSMCGASKKVAYLAEYICELSLLDADVFLKFLPSITAAGALALANYVLGNDMWDEALVASSGYQLKELTDVISCLYNKYASMPTCPQKAMYDKYKVLKYKYVSTIPAPKELVFPKNAKSQKLILTV